MSFSNHFKNKTFLHNITCCNRFYYNNTLQNTREIKRKNICIYCFAALIAIAAVTGLYFAVTYDDSVPIPVNIPSTEFISRELKLSKGCDTQHEKYKAGVVTNGVECAEIGSAILKLNGSAADAAIAALFCEGVAQPQSMGLGGGFLLTIYTRATRTAETLDARERAPLAAHRDMFEGNETLAATGPLSIAVPGELKGYWELHKKYGKLPWEMLVRPTINLCKTGNLCTPYLAKVLKNNENKILNEPSLREIFINPLTNRTWQAGDKIKRLKLAKTLEIIAKEGGDALNNGSLTKMFVEDIQKLGGIITEKDMNIYQPTWEPAINATFQDNLTLYSSPLPGSGVILTFILNILNDYLDNRDMFTSHNLHRIVESFKFGYGRRTELGDIPGLDELLANLTSPEYAKYIRNKIFDNTTFQDPVYYGANYSLVEDHGTAHINVLAPNGDAVSVTSTINLILGSKLRSESTGIILNDEMDDFSAPNITNSFDIPPSPANYIEPGKRPLSSMCPSIFVDKSGDVRLIIGGAGGSKITTSTALVAMKNTWFNQPLKEAIDSKRLHHQLFPMNIFYELHFNKEIVDELSRLGHKAEFVNTMEDGFAAVTAISKQCDTVFGAFDKRRQGSVSLF